MLFCDVKGSTAAASRLDPEEWAEIINGAFEHMITPVYRYEGTVARLMGDGILAFFGAPLAHEDDPQRATLAGLAIVAAIKSYRARVLHQWGIDLDVRIGINTGLVVVGAVGSDLRMEYTALGDAINLAARMEQTAQPGTVQIAEPTYKLVSPLFDVEALEYVEIKGKAEPMRAFRVLGEKATPGPLRGIAGLHSPLVGRDREAAALWSAVERMQAGSGQIVSVMGEAGLGKSRLIAEVRDAVDLDPTYQLQWLEGRSLSYETTTPFAPFIDLLSGYFRLQAGQSDGERYALIAERLALLFGEQGRSMAPFLASLFSLPIPDPDAERVRYLEPPMLRAGIFSRAATLVERLAGNQPLVLVLDDVHWIDPTSLELLESLLPLTERAPLLIVLSFRPRRQEPSWRLHELAQRDYAHRYTSITLQPLDQMQARALVANLLHVEDLPESVRQLILDKSEGNPFFVEEVIRSLLDSGLVVREDDHWRATADIVTVSVPDTLTGVITARLDRLDDATRQIVQAASVIGRDFSYDTLADILGATNGKLNASMTNLVQRQLVREKSLHPRRVYTFKHVMTQEAAYNSALLSLRRDLHRRTAESLVQRAPEQAADIARHFLEARQPARAMPYLVAAGDRAARNYASQEAIEHYRKAVGVQAAVEDLVFVRQAYEGLGGMLTLTNQPAEALSTFQAMLSLGEQRSDIPMQVSALNKSAGVLALHMGQFAEGESYLARADQLVKAYNEQGGAAESALIRCQICTMQADFDGVKRHMDNLVSVGEAIGSREFQAMGMEHVASSLMFMTRFDEAWEKGQEALAIAREIGDRAHEAWVMATTLSICLIRDGKFDEARRMAEEGIQIAERIGFLEPQIYGNWCISEIHRGRGEYEQALQYAQRSLDAALPLEGHAPFMAVQPLGTLGSVYLEISPKFIDVVSQYHLHALRLLENPAGMMGGGTAWADLGWCAMTLGDEEIAGESFEKGLHYPTMFMMIERPRYLAGAALLASRQGRQAEALQLAEEACVYAEERGMRNLYPLMRLASGRAQAARGHHQAALAQFTISAQRAQDLSMRPILWQAQAGSAASLNALNRPDDAAVHRSAALSTIDEITALFADQTLAAEFRAAAAARAVS
ncbi:MAG: adenylate/guanylate cyclase domain-containing protein [Caldilineales bacterium]